MSRTDAPGAGGAGTGGAPAAGAVPAQGLRHAVRAFRHRDFAIFWTGALASNTGSWVQNLAVPYVLYQLTESAFWVGLATFTQFIPAMVLGPLAGSIADRYDRRKVLFVTQSLLALAAIALWGAWVGGVRDAWAILALVALSGVFAGINIPSWQSFVNDLVPRDDLLSAVTLNSLQFNAARAIGPGIAGILLATLGPGWAFFLNATSFVFVLGALALVRTRQEARSAPLTGGFLRQFRRAMRYTRQSAGILVGMVVRCSSPPSATRCSSSPSCSRRGASRRSRSASAAQRRRSASERPRRPRRRAAGTRPFSRSTLTRGRSWSTASPIWCSPSPPATWSGSCPRRVGGGSSSSSPPRTRRSRSSSPTTCGAGSWRLRSWPSRAPTRSAP
jgi:hypothetical protein